MTGKKIAVGRPRFSVDFAIVLRIRDVENLGWPRMAVLRPFFLYNRPPVILPVVGTGSRAGDRPQYSYEER